MLVPLAAIGAIELGIIVVIAVVAVAIGIAVGRGGANADIDRLADAAHQLGTDPSSAHIPPGMGGPAGHLAAELEHLGEQLASAATAQSAADGQDSSLRVLDMLPQRMSEDSAIIEGLELAIYVGNESHGFADVVPTTHGAYIVLCDVDAARIARSMALCLIKASVRSMVAGNATVSPHELLANVNQVLYHSLAEPMAEHIQARVTVAKYHRDGSVVVAGCHESITVARARSGEVIPVRMRETWFGGLGDLTSVALEESVTLKDSDLIVLFSDGLSVGGPEKGTRLSSRDLGEVVHENRRTPGEKIKYVLAAASKEASEANVDDATIIVARHRASYRYSQQMEVPKELLKAHKANNS